jgi:hypothetical protein
LSWLKNLKNLHQYRLDFSSGKKWETNHQKIFLFAESDPC